MDTDVRTPLQIFSIPQHLVVPVFQRRYVWDADTQWEPLWRDIRRVADSGLPGGTPTRHFLGAIVTQATPAGLGSLAVQNVIDGQQRLTTLQLVLDATAAELEAAGLSRLAQQLQGLTHNAAAYGGEDADRLKLRHLNDDRAPFTAVMNALPPIDYESLPASRLRQAHRYFAEQVRDYLGDPVDPTRARAMVTALTGGLQLVVIALTEAEPSQEIFETLNARGTPLTAADLIKNFVFRQLAVEGANASSAYQRLWKPFEAGFWEKEVRIGSYQTQRLSLFFNHWLVAQTGEEVSTRSTFTRFKSWFADSGRVMTEVLDSIHRQADQYKEWSVLAGRATGDLGAVPLFIYRTEAVGIEAVKPILLWLFDTDRGLPVDVAEEALRDVESWVIRRALLRHPTSDYSRIVAGLISGVRGAPTDHVPAALRDALRNLNRPGTYWPGDQEVRETLRTSKIYAQRNANVRVYLEAAEDHARGYVTGTPRAESRVTRGKLTIEHLLPQSWATSWPVENPDAEDARQAHVDVLGNLTLLTQRLNSSVSNQPWAGSPSKRDALRTSDTLLLTRQVRNEEAWDEQRIDRRTQQLADALIATWPAPEGHNPTLATSTVAPRRRRMTIRDLVLSGRLAVGTRLYAHDHRGEHTAIVTTDGRLEVNGRVYSTPSAAGGDVDGWQFWRLPDGSRLTSLRDPAPPGRPDRPAEDKLATLLAMPGSETLVRNIGLLLRATLPGRLGRGGSVWALSALPGTGSGGLRRLFTLSVGSLELAYALQPTDTRDAVWASWRLNLDQATMPDHLRQRLDEPSGRYALDGVVEAEVPGEEVRQALLGDDMASVRALADRLAARGRTPYGRHHSARLVEIALAATDPGQHPAEDPTPTSSL